MSSYRVRVRNVLSQGCSHSGRPCDATTRLTRVTYHIVALVPREPCYIGLIASKKRYTTYQDSKTPCCSRVLANSPFYFTSSIQLTPSSPHPHIMPLTTPDEPISTLKNTTTESELTVRLMAEWKETQPPLPWYRRQVKHWEKRENEKNSNMVLQKTEYVTLKKSSYRESRCMS